MLLSLAAGSLSASVVWQRRPERCRTALRGFCGRQGRSAAAEERKGGSGMAFVAQWPPCHFPAAAGGGGAQAQRAHRCLPPGYRACTRKPQACPRQARRRAACPQPQAKGATRGLGWRAIIAATRLHAAHGDAPARGTPLAPPPAASEATAQGAARGGRMPTRGRGGGQTAAAHDVQPALLRQRAATRPPSRTSVLARSVCIFQAHTLSR